jgi:hypothetical protein
MFIDSNLARREQLQTELAVLQEQRRQQEGTVGNIENMKLKERFQEIIDNFLAQEAQKIQEVKFINIFIIKKLKNYFSLIEKFYILA